MTRRSPSVPVIAIFDLDGTVYQDDSLIVGAREAIAACRSAGCAIRFATNTTRMSRIALCAKLRTMGLELSGDEVHTAPVTAATILRARKLRRVLPLLPEETWKDLDGLELVSERADAVLVGDCGPGFTFDLLNRGFRELLSGAELIACQRNRFWRSDGQFLLDAGAFVAALEYAANVSADLIGKPSPAFFQAAVESAAPSSEGSVVVIGDDVHSDIAGATASGFDSVLVRTGKFRVEDLERSAVQPTWVLDSIADLPQLFDLQR